MSIFIGGAWPYANGPLHIGHVAALLPGDILARYYRTKGEEVLYVSGSDCHGTPISVRAKQEGVEPKDIADKYHKEFFECFQKLGFTYDLYTRTDDDFHKKEVKKIFLNLYKNGYIYEKEQQQLYCTNCEQFLPDRFVEGACPHCGSKARGDQCDNCSTLLDPLELTGRSCKNCGNEPVVRKTRQLFFRLSAFQQELKEYLNGANGWRINAVNMTERYLREGLQDRAVSRDLPWGIEIPLRGFEDKKLYVWVDAVLGYLTASKHWSELNTKDWRKFWEEKSTAYYVHGKDNIPFHTIILPALLKGSSNYKLPSIIISSEYLTIEGKKLSTSNNWAVWTKDLLKDYNPDAIRYFLIINGPEKRDTDFSWREFINSNNGELVGAYGNLVNRTLVFVQKYFDGEVPNGISDENISIKIKGLYEQCGTKIERGEFKAALEEIFEFVRSMNKYFDEQKPWLTIKQDKSSCGNAIYNCIEAIVNLSNLLEPFLPFSSSKISKWIGFETSKWSYVKFEPQKKIADTEVLFERIDKKMVEYEISKLGK